MDFPQKDKTTCFQYDILLITGYYEEEKENSYKDYYIFNSSFRA